MARKKRDYKAEYAAAKRRATAAGYKSEREYKAVRKQLKLPPRTSPVPKRVIQREQPDIVERGTRLSRMRSAAKAWSKKHSHVNTSRYDPKMSDDQLEKYYRAYVEPLPHGLSRRERAREKRRRIRDYLIPEWFSESEWESKYQPV